MRILKLTVLVAAVVLFGCSGVAAAAPKNYCADLKAWIRARRARFRCQTRLQRQYQLRPTTPDQKSVADYITQTRDGFLNVAKSPAPATCPTSLDITATNYGSAIPPRGTQAVVLKTYQQVGGAHLKPCTGVQLGPDLSQVRSPTPRRRTTTKPAVVAAHRRPPEGRLPHRAE